jgi:putative transposase
MSIAYAFVDGQWLRCTADALFQVQGRSEREWQLILDEWREQQRQHARRRVSIDGPLLAQFLEEIATEEQLLLQRQRDLEGLPVREAIVGPRHQILKPPEAEAEVDDEELDLAALPQYEEYR